MKTQIMPVTELVEVLRDELAAHHHLLQLELAKREAIIARDGEKLKASAAEQTKELHKIDLLESRRDRLAQQILTSEADGLQHASAGLRLSEIIASQAVSAPEKKELSRYQMALKSALAELKKISEVNAKMLIDSRDLFRTMIMSLAGKERHRGAGSLGTGAGIRPLLVDANC